MKRLRILRGTLRNFGLDIGDVSIAVRAIKVGALEFIERPFEEAVLVGVVEAPFARIAAADDASARAAEA